MRNIKFAVVVCVVTVLIAVTCFVFSSNINVSAVEEFRVDKSSQTAQTLAWKQDNKKTKKEIYYSVDGGQTYKLLDIVEGDETQYEVDGLTDGTLYSYKIVSVNQLFGKEYKSEEVVYSAYTAPKGVTDLSAATQSAESLTAMWNNGVKADGYEIKYSENKDLSDAKVVEFKLDEVVPDTQKGTVNYIIPDLTEGNTYYLALRCYLQSGNNKTYSQWCEPVGAKVTRAVDMTGIDITKPMIALTYDDGPDYTGITEDILDVLSQYNGHATFFQLGDRSTDCSDVVKKIVEQGHEIGNHTYDHSHYGSSVTEEDIVKANEYIKKACGVEPTVFRSTGGLTTDKIRSVCHEEGMSLFKWNLDTRDWETRNADSIVNSIKNYVSDGDIILMHNIYESTAEASRRIIPWLSEQGYQLVTVSQLVQAKTGNPPEAGVQYYTATQTD